MEHVTGMDEKMNNLRVALEDLTLAARDHEVCIDGCLSRGRASSVSTPTMTWAASRAAR